MSNTPSVTFHDLDSAYEWVCVSGYGENSALISKATGQIFYTSDSHDCDEDLPEDIDEEDLYWSVPHKNDLDLGKELVFRFAAECMSDEEQTIHDFFRRRGAYAKFRQLLERTGHLDEWYAFEQEATKRALLEWAEEEGLKVDD